MPRKKRLNPIPVTVSDVEIGKRIAERRIELGLTQLQLAKSMGLIQSLISAYERGILRLTAEMIVRFSQVLGLSADYLLNTAHNEMKSAFPKKITTRMSGIQKMSDSNQRYLFRVIDLYINSESRRMETESSEDNEYSADEEAEAHEKKTIRRKKVIPWSPEEIEMLSLYFPKLQKKEILDLLPKRTWLDCLEEAQILNLSRELDDYQIKRNKATPSKRGGPRGPMYRWDEVDRLIIKNLYPYASKKDIARKLKHRTWHAIQKEASRLGIKRMISDNDEY